LDLNLIREINPEFAGVFTWYDLQVKSNIAHDILFREHEPVALYENGRRDCHAEASQGGVATHPFSSFIVPFARVMKDSCNQTGSIKSGSK
jgi:hypothetical protein